MDNLNENIRTNMSTFQRNLKIRMDRLQERLKIEAEKRRREMEAVLKIDLARLDKGMDFGVGRIFNSSFGGLGYAYK